MKLIAIDLDGTLLSKDGIISEENVRALQDAQKQGHVVTICTGRSLIDAKQILQNVGIDCPMITGNGAVSYYDNKLIQEWTLKPELVTELLSLVESQQFFYQIYTNKGTFMVHDGRDRLESEIEKQIAADPDFPAEWARKEVDIEYAQHGLLPYEQFEQNTGLPVNKVYVLSFDKQKLKQLREMLEGRTDLSLTTSGWTKLEIAHPAANKGSGLRHMAEYIGIPLEETVAIGDQWNDLPMFEVAGMSIAMGNAAEEVKAISTYVTKTQSENGVAHALRSFVLD